MGLAPSSVFESCTFYKKLYMATITVKVTTSHKYRIVKFTCKVYMQRLVLGYEDFTFLYFTFW